VTGDTATTTNPFEDILNADEVAAWLKVDRKSVYNAASRGAIPHQRLGKRLLFSRTALMAWLGRESGSARR
jgi:excisionase family DNA binding protein